MWPWIKRWLDWAMSEFGAKNRAGQRPQALHFGYEKAGLLVHDQPIPWNAEAVLVEALVQRRGLAKTDFQLLMAGHEPVPAESVRPDESSARCHVFFRLPPIGKLVAVDVQWRSNTLGTLTLPFVGRDEFLQNLRLELPTLFVRLGQRSVPCQTFVTTQCRGLIVSAVLGSPTSLAPLWDLGLVLEIRCERRGTVQRIPASLTAAQLAGRQALVSVVLPRPPKRSGSWTITWRVGATALTSHHFRAVSAQHFLRSLRVADARFVLQSGKEASLRRQAPPLAEQERLGPCFFVASRESGIAGICRLSVHAESADGKEPRLLADEDVLVTDGQTMFMPGTLDPESVARTAGFELRLKDRPLGTLALSPAPKAQFTGEGAFKSPGDYLWTEVAEEELKDRLGKLLGGSSSG